MSNDLLAQWHRRLAGRGAAATALLIVPIAMAAVIGFNGGLGGVTGGFFSALDGPEPQAAGATTPPGLPGAARAASTAAAGTGDDGGGGATGGGGAGDGSPSAPGAPSGPNPPTGRGVGIPGGEGVPVPVDDPSGTAESIVSGVNRTLDGLTGNR